MRQEPRFPHAPLKHGTGYAYIMGCRCDECRAAIAKDRREYRQRVRDRQQQGNAG